jgi:hypothetical protein
VAGDARRVFRQKVSLTFDFMWPPLMRVDRRTPGSGSRQRTVRVVGLAPPSAPLVLRGSHFQWEEGQDICTTRSGDSCGRRLASATRWRYKGAGRCSAVRQVRAADALPGSRHRRVTRLGDLRCRTSLPAPRGLLSGAEVIGPARPPTVLIAGSLARRHNAPRCAAEPYLNDTTAARAHRGQRSGSGALLSSSEARRSPRCWTRSRTSSAVKVS